MKESRRWVVGECFGVISDIATADVVPSIQSMEESMRGLHRAFGPLVALMYCIAAWDVVTTCE